MSDPLQVKKWRVDRERGVPALMRSPETALLRNRLRGFHDRGMPYRLMAEQAGVSATVISKLVRSGGGMHRTSYVKLCRIRFAESDQRGAQMSPVGVMRRVQALCAAGYPMTFLSGGSSRDHAHLYRALAGVLKRTHAEYDVRIRQMYDKLSGVDPIEAGVSRHGRAYARGQAHRRGYAPPTCWDPDTIDDPEAIPEWTGACGTGEGLRIHQREGIPACPACQGVNLGPAAAKVRLDPAKIRAAREARGMSLVDVGRALGINDSTIHYWETGRSAPRNRNVIDRYLAVLDLNPEEAT